MTLPAAKCRTLSGLIQLLITTEHSSIGTRPFHSVASCGGFVPCYHKLVSGERLKPRLHLWQSVQREKYQNCLILMSRFMQALTATLWYNLGYKFKFRILLHIMKIDTGALSSHVMHETLTPHGHCTDRTNIEVNERTVGGVCCIFFRKKLLYG